MEEERAADRLAELEDSTQETTVLGEPGTASSPKLEPSQSAASLTSPSSPTSADEKKGGKYTIPQHVLAQHMAEKKRQAAVRALRAGSASAAARR
jgi:hypothetical protein